MAIIKKKPAVKKAALGATVPKPKVKAKGLPPSGKQTPADFYPESYDKKFPRTKGGGANYNGPAVEPLKKDPTGMSRNGSKLKKAKNGFDLNKDGKTTFKDVLIGRGVIKAKSGASMKKCKYGCK